jgi:uncharacterized membrane protein
MPFHFKPSRVEAFSDGVLAIIITLLVLELKVPHLVDAMSRGEAFSALGALTPKILSFILSFIYVATFWVNHHHFFHLVKEVNEGLVWQNNSLLLCLSFIPFPTAFIGDYPQNAVALSFFAFVLTLAGIVFNVMWQYSYKRGLLNEDIVTPAYIKKAKRMGMLGPICYFVAGISAFIMPMVAWALLILIPAYYLLPGKSRST